VNASRRRIVAEAYMDGAYDSSKTYGLLRRMSIGPIIKPRRDARLDRGPPERRKRVRIFGGWAMEWCRLMNYGRCWSAETTFSTFKR
jgi:hypothetical protein